MTWVPILLGGGGFAVVMTGLASVFVRSGRVIQAVDDVASRVSRLETRVDNLTNGRGQHYSSH